MDAPESTPATSPSPPAPAAGGPVFFVSLPPAAQAALVLLLTFVLGMLAGTYLSRGPAPLALSPGRVDLNRASAGELRLLPGLGEQLALRIEEDRRKRGPFQSLDDLRRVPGIGPKTLQGLQEHLVIYQNDGTSLIDPQPRVASTRQPKGDDLSDPIDVNEASLADLQKIPGIGPVKAKSIFDQRARKPFQTINDLDRVPGIGPKTIEKLKPYIFIRPPATVAAVQDQ